MTNGKLILGSFAVETGEPLIVVSSDTYENIANVISKNFGSWSHFNRSNNNYRQNTGVPSPIMSIEFLCPNPSGSDVVNVSYDTDGVGIAEVLGSPVATLLGRRLRELGYTRLCRYVSPGIAYIPEDEYACQHAFVSQEIDVEHADFESLLSLESDCNTWITTDAQEMISALSNPDSKSIRSAIERSVFWPFERYNRKYLTTALGAIVLSSISSVDRLLQVFPKGCVIRKMLGNEASRLHRLEPEPKHERDDRWYESASHIDNLIASSEAKDLIACPLGEPSRVRLNDGKYREHLKAFFIFRDGAYRLVGGYAFGVRSGRVELADKAMVRAIHVPQQQAIAA